MKKNYKNLKMKLKKNLNKNQKDKILNKKV